MEAEQQGDRKSTKLYMLLLRCCVIVEMCMQAQFSACGDVQPTTDALAANNVELYCKWVCDEFSWERWANKMLSAGAAVLRHDLNDRITLVKEMNNNERTV